MDNFSGYNEARLRDELKNEKLHALREAGLLQDQEVINYLENYKRNYTKGQAQHHKDNTKTAQKYYNSVNYVNTVRDELNKTLSWAIRTGNKGVINHALGLAENEKEDLETAYTEIFEEFSRDASVSMLRGAPGTGKSTKAITIAEDAIKLNYLDNVCTNIAIENPEEMKNWFYRTKLSKFLEFSQKSGNNAIIWDEISRLLNMKAGNRSDSYDTASLINNLLPALRKNAEGNLHIIIIAHRDDTDTFKVFRSYTNIIINSYDRDEKDKAQIYKDHVLETPEFAWDRYQDDNTKPDADAEGFNPIRNPYLQLDTNKSAKLELDTDNINKSDYPEIFNSLEGAEENNTTNSQGNVKGISEEMKTKIKAVSEYQNTNKSYSEIADKYEVSKGTIHNWVTDMEE